MQNAKVEEQFDLLQAQKNTNDPNYEQNVLKFYQEVEVDPKTIGIELLVGQAERAKENQRDFQSFVATSRRLDKGSDKNSVDEYYDAMEECDDDELDEF